MAIKKITAPSLGPNVFSNTTIINQIITSSNDPVINTAPTKINTSAIEDAAITNTKLASTGLDITKFNTGALDISLITDGTIVNAKLATSGLDISKFDTGTLDVSLITDSTLSVDKLNASGTRNSNTFLSGNNTFETISIPPSVSISGAGFTASGSGGPDNQTSFASSGGITIDANKSGAFTFTSSYSASTDASAFAGVRMQLAGSTVGSTTTVTTRSTGNQTFGNGFGSMTFSSTGSNRTLTVQVGRRGVGGAPGNAEFTGHYTLYYTGS